MARPSVVGQEVYERTNALVAEGKTRTEAFEQIAQERGQQPGTVAANFYRVARKNAPAKPQRTRAPRRPALAPEPASNGSMATQLEACIRSMVDEAVDRRMQRLVG